MKRLSFALLFMLSATAASYAQDLKLPALSPSSKITQEFSTSSIEISYSRPSMRGRKIFGELVAYGNVWRTGANSATKVKFGEDVVIEGNNIKAGEYALYTIPGQKEWEIILNKGVGNWGNAGYATADDVARFKVTPRELDKNVNTFTMQIGNITYNSCNIELMWEKTKVIIPVKSNNEERLNAAIDKAINNPNIPYFQAANYYYETGQNLDKANQYVDKALEQNPKAFYMWALKARIAQKMGRKDEAIAAANKSMETAKGSAFEAEYTRNNQKIIDSYKAKK
jgi:tetratricopeptide (TPR) repeat protein